MDSSGELGRNKLPKIREQMLQYEALDANFDFQQVIQWKVFNRNNQRHMDILEGADDPVSYEDLREVAESGEDEVVQLPCATEKFRCNYTKTSISKCLMAKPECIVCNTRYQIPGSQPSGTMEIELNLGKFCEGHFGIGTIIMDFDFPAGTQGPNHPQPGKKYLGGRKTSYIPYTEEGVECLNLLIKAFEGGHLFTIGTSLTMGGRPRLVFSSIHLKTSRTGGPTRHGWPDETYFDRVKSECAAKMIFSESMNVAIEAQNEGTSEDLI